MTRLPYMRHQDKIQITKAFNKRRLYHAAVFSAFAVFVFLAHGEFLHATSVEIGREWNYTLTRKTETFIAPEEGEYFLEVWGASGGDDGGTPGGKGGYASGYMRLDVGDKLDITVGGKGQTGPETDLLDPGIGFSGGYNGGGDAWANNGYRHASGGGMTDIQKGRNYIMVAGGGGGGDAYGDSKGGDGGGGSGGNASQNDGTPGRGGTQNSGGRGANNGSPGKGGASSEGNLNGGSGGGAGYHGGGGGTTSGGGGGSGYIDKSIYDGRMVSGNNNGNGKAKITLVTPWEGEGSTEIIEMDQDIMVDVNIGAYKYITNKKYRFFKIMDDKLKKLQASNIDFLIDTPQLSMKMPHEALKKLKTSPDGYKVFQLDASTNKTKKDIVDKIKEDLNQTRQKIEEQGEVYRLKLFDVNNQKVSLVKSFEKPLRIILKEKNFNNKEHTAVFYLEVEYKNDYKVDSVSTIYQGGVFDIANNPEHIGFYTDHFSLFIVMERTPPPFNDIDNSYAKEAILQLASLNILKGIDKKKFGRNESVKRVDFSIGLNIAMARLPVSYTAVFDDVNKGDYFAGHVLSLAALKIPNKVSESKFGVKDGQDYRLMTRLDAAIFLSNAILYNAKNHENYAAFSSINPPFTDFSNIPKAHQQAVRIVYQTDLFRGMPDNENGGVKFAPEQNLTREQFAVILANYLKKTGNTFFRPLPEIN